MTKADAVQIAQVSRDVYEVNAQIVNAYGTPGNYWVNIGGDIHISRKDALRAILHYADKRID